MRHTRTEHRAAATLAVRATMAADAAARAPDVASAQGGWEEEPREEGGATDKKEPMLHLPDSSSLVGVSEFSLAIPESPLPICASAFPFLDVNVPRAPSPALPPRLPLRDHHLAKSWSSGCFPPLPAAMRDSVARTICSYGSRQKSRVHSQHPSFLKTASRRC
jgi:hypothetical protein